MYSPLLAPPNASLAAGRSGALPIELRSPLLAVGLQRALLAHRVRPLKNPILPRREAAEDLRLERFGTRKTQVRFEAGERVRRQRGARLDGQAHFIVPVNLVGRERHQPRLLGFSRRKTSFPLQ